MVGRYRVVPDFGIPDTGNDENWSGKDKRLLPELLIRYFCNLLNFLYARRISECDF